MRTKVRSRPGCALALALAFLTLGGQVAALSHTSLVRHAICPEHGEPIHVGGAHDEHPGAARGAPAYGSAEGDLPTHQHEHCLLASTQRHGTAAPVDGISSACPAADRASPPAGRSTAAAAIDLLRLAPKHSPPA